MKKSEYEAKRWTAWGAMFEDQAAPIHRAAWIREHVRDDVAACEAADIAWDPEESALPERLAWAPAHDCGGPFNAHLFPLSLDGWSDAGTQSAAYERAVQRYNDFPALEARAAEEREWKERFEAVSREDLARAKAAEAKLAAVQAIVDELPAADNERRPDPCRYNCRLYAVRQALGGQPAPAPPEAGARQYVPCGAQSFSGGTPTPLICMREKGHPGRHSVAGAVGRISWD